MNRHTPEGVPPAVPSAPPGHLVADTALRAELEALSERQLDRRAAKVGVSEDKIDQADAAEDPRASLIDFIIEAEGRPTGPLNIKQRLDKEEWKASEDSTDVEWWQDPDLAEQVNRLRAAARIRASLPDNTRVDIPDLYPQLVVLGDGNTGKSTVLNRFAEFAFSSITDGVCTRRPVRLQLRPVVAENRARMTEEGLLAICKMVDTQDHFEQEFKFRKAHREDDEGVLRRAVEKRASEAAAQDGTSAAFDRQYIEDELVITIEADQMIYFDLLDLPGLDNSSQMPKKMVKHYINKHSLSHTFVLIFAEHRNGDTQLMHSLAFAIMHDVAAELDDTAAWGRFLTERCLGVLTKVDKELENNSKKGAAQYNRDAADKLRRSLMCKEHPPHLDKWPWVAVLNPNPNEQLQNMTFVEACRKEDWFFDDLFSDDEDARELCGIDNFRAKLVELYDQFVAAQMKMAAPRVFAKVLTYTQHMSDKWAWEAQEESYENPQMMMAKLNEMINQMVNIGRSTSMPMSSIEILLRDDVDQCFDRCRNQMDPATAVENSKQDILGTMANIMANLIEQVHAAAFYGKFRRFVTMGEHMIKVLVFLAKQCLDQAEQTFDAVITGRRPGGVPLLNALIASAKSELLGLATMVEELPLLPPRYLVMDPPDYLEHARPLTVTAAYPFGFVYNVDGLVTKVTDTERCEIPVGSTIIQVEGRQFSLQNMLECSEGGRHVSIAYSQPGCSAVPNRFNVTKWMYHYEHVSREYLEERERFLSHRRAADNLVLVFHTESVGVAGRAEFERLQGGHHLVRLTSGDDRDWYRPPRFHGERPTRPQVRLGLQVSLPGMCCTKGCSQAHDTAFNPCGHTVSCWECAQKLDQCPVCCMDLTDDRGNQLLQTRRPKDLCYDHPSTEAEHEDNVRAGVDRDAEAYEASRAGYKSLLLMFREHAEQDAEMWEVLAEERREQMRVRPDAIPGQCDLWPYHRHMIEQKAMYEQLMQQQQRQAAADKARAVADASNLASAGMLEYAKTLEAVLKQRDARVKKEFHTPDAGIDACQAPTCTNDFGLLKRRHHCRACGGIFCDDCAGKNGFEFETAGMKGAERKARRVCGECKAALEDSDGVRNCNVPANRPDGTPFGS